MKKNLPILLSFCALAIFSLLTPLAACAQTVEFSDNFDGGTSAWLLTGGYGTSTLYSYSGSSSLTESPAGNYGDGITASATMATGVDLSSALDANLSFWAIYSIEEGFDYTYLEVSGDGGPWIQLDAIDGEGMLSPWVQYTYSLGAFAGNSDVKIRFRFVSDGAVNYDGMYIDDFEITSSNTDLAAPLIIYEGPLLYEGNLGDFVVSAEILDPSGIASTTLSYTVDGGTVATVAGTPSGGTFWNYTIPEQAAGAWVQFTLTATDASTASNSGTTNPYRYIAGNYIAYDNAEIDFVNSFGPSALSGSTAAAVRITLAGASDLVAVLIRNYTDPTRPNNNIEVHVWSDAGGFPGVDLLTPLTVTPEATLAAPNQMTRVDLRPYLSSLSGLTGDIWIGFEVPVGEAWLSQTTPGIAGRTATLSGGLWNSISDDYHFRAITTAPLGAPSASFSIDAAADPVVLFNDLSTNSPISWSWTFGDGGTSTDQNPTHEYTENGTFSVCLTATNATGNDTECQSVVISGVPITPSPDFDFIVAINEVSFTDASANEPTSWSWDFDDGSTSTDQNPIHIYTAVGNYEVCLISSNTAGTSSPYCRTVPIISLPSGLNVVPILSWQLSPNPAGDWLNIQFNEALSQSSVLQLIDLSGKVLLTQTIAKGSKQHQIETLSWQPGLYILTLTNPQETYRSPIQIAR